MGLGLKFEFSEVFNVIFVLREGLRFDITSLNASGVLISMVEGKMLSNFVHGT